MGPATVTITGVAAGGDGVGRLPDGRAVFVRSAITGDRVAVDVHEDKPRFARATVVDVLDPAPGRIEPPCPHQDEGCGGCGWQHVDVPTQRRLKARVVVDALVHVGRLDPASIPEVDLGPDLPGLGHRTTVRAAVDGEGRLGLRTHHGHAVVPFGDVGCPVAHPLVDDVLRSGRFPGAREVTVRAGVATGEVLVVVDPADVDELRAGRRMWFHEEVAGQRWRISARSFFQTRPDGAEALVDAVRAAVGEPKRFVDLYAGVGLFAGSVPGAATAVESNRSAVADARVNVPDARVIAVDVRKWRPSPFDAVVADPSRHGLGAAVVDRVAATGAMSVALVSCDAGALGRDAGLLAAAGYRLDGVTLVDLFPQTPHVEVVTAWRRHPATAPAS